MVNVFAVPVFFICFRECLETTIIVSILLAFLKQSLATSANPDLVLHKRLVRQVWLGTLVGLVLCLIIGAAMIAVFYKLGQDVFSKTEDLWEGIFALLASLIITVVGAALLRVSKMQDKWRKKIRLAVEAKAFSSTAKTTGADGAEGKAIKMSVSERFKLWAEKYAMFLLPFITVLREGLEAVVFIGGVGVGLPASSFPLAVLCGLGAGCLIGFFIYKGGNKSSLQIFLIISTCFLYLVAAGLFTRAVWSFENYKWNKIVGGDAAEVGAGPGSYDIRQSVWHVNCCSPELSGGSGWGVFNSLFGWTNSATYGSVISYNVYWIVVIVGFLYMGWREKRSARRGGGAGGEREEVAASSDGGSEQTGEKNSKVVGGGGVVREVEV